MKYQAIAFGAAALAPFAAYGCSMSPDDCHARATCALAPTVDAGEEAPACDRTKAPSEAACVVDDRYGVFVSARGRKGASGSKLDPVPTIDEGLRKAKATGKRVYVCAGAYAEALVIDAALDGVSVFGALSCDAWTWDPKERVVIAPPTHGVALRLSHLSLGAHFEDVELVARDAEGAGESSVGAFVSQSQNVSFLRVTVRAGNGQAGAHGGGASNYDLPVAPSGDAPQGSTGGAGGAIVCKNGSSSTGGKGANNGGGTGATGQWNPAGTTSEGRDGSGGIGGGPSCTTFPAPGADGAPSAAAEGADVWGKLTADGWHSESGRPGNAGNPGQGGGGGGSTSSKAGGGGGAGGCGGAGGLPGQGGGSSIAVLIFQSAVRIHESTLVALNAGDGGNGGPGQAGQAGGDVGLATCSGAQGGNGAGGGGGGGGAGGLSLGIGYVGIAPTLDEATQITVGAPGKPGGPGAGAPGGNNGLGPAPSGPAGMSGLLGDAAKVRDLG